MKYQPPAPVPVIKCGQCDAERHTHCTLGVCKCSCGGKEKIPIQVVDDRKDGPATNTETLMLDLSDMAYGGMPKLTQPTTPLLRGMRLSHPHEDLTPKTGKFPAFINVGLTSSGKLLYIDDGIADDIPRIVASYELKEVVELKVERKTRRIIQDIKKFILGE